MSARLRFLMILFLVVPEVTHATFHNILDRNTNTTPASNLRIQPCLCIPLSVEVRGLLPTHLQGAETSITSAVTPWKQQVTHLRLGGGPGLCSPTSPVTICLTPHSFPGTSDKFAETVTTANKLGIHSLTMAFNMDSLYVNKRADSWTKTAPATQEIHLPSIALHEMGHGIGLKDVASPSSPTIMQLDYPRGTMWSLQQWDIEATKYLYGNDPCGQFVPIKWGGFKSLYAGYTTFDGAVALSGIDNTIAWNHLPGDSTRTYFVYRSEHDDEPVTLVGMTFADSIFVDDDVEFGKEYNYHVASADSTTLLDIGLGNAGLKQVSSNILTAELADLNYSEALAVRGDNLFASSFDRIARINISDPANPVITASRTTDVFDDGVRMMALSSDATKLYVVTYSGFVVLDATSPGLAVLGALWNLTPDCCADGDFVVDMRVDGDIVYLAGGKNGLLAIDVWNPSNPQIAGIHPTGLETSWAVRIELVDEYVYHLRLDFRTGEARAPCCDQDLEPAIWASLGRGF